MRTALRIFDLINDTTLLTIACAPASCRQLRHVRNRVGR